MARIRPTDTDFIKKLMAFQKSYFTVGDLEKILGLKRESLYVTLSRLTKSGILLRLRKNAYTLFTQIHDAEKAANELYYPCYLSFEKALSLYGILSQVPYTYTFATMKPSKKMKIGNVEVEYSHIKEDLFFGYILKNGKNIALPEKALLDELYLVSRGLRTVNIEELDLKEIDKKRLEEFAEKYPPYIGDLLSETKKYIGTTPITNEAKERIEWNEKKKIP
jgi:predicted transcriptional regulator of viral defense system